MHRARWTASFVPVALVALAGILAACGYGNAGASGDVGSIAPQSAPPPTDTPTIEVSLNPSLPSQSETEWGPIWDELPATFPIPPGAEPAAAEKGPVSASYTVPVASSTARQLAELYEAGLNDRGYSATIDEALEDGSITTWSTNGAGCDVLVTILPRGNESLITVLYGTGCAFE
jgi:hypothetical protein